MKETLLVLGPYVGDWETEIILFRPYVRWISKILSYDKIFISTHANRSFLYNWVDINNITPIYGNLSRDELYQKGIINKNLQQKDFYIIQKQLLHQIQSTRKKNKNSIYNFFLNYTNRNIHYPFYKRIYEKIPTDIKERNGVFFIPDNSETDINLRKILECVKNFNPIIIGDMKTHLNEENIILKQIDYFENGYKYIIEKISNAKIVICPLSHWTFICELQGTPVISWATITNNKYMMLENSKNCVIINDNNINSVCSVLKSYIERYL